MNLLNTHMKTKREDISEYVVSVQNDIINREYRPESGNGQGIRKTMRKYPETSSSQQTFIIKDNHYTPGNRKSSNLLTYHQKMDMHIKRSKKNEVQPAGVPNETKPTGNYFILPQWQKSGTADPIDPSAVKFEISRNKQDLPGICSSINFHNMETKANAWTMETLYNPLTGGEFETEEPRKMNKLDKGHRSMKVLPSSINHSR